MTNKRAHELVNEFKGIADHYNKTRLRDCCDGMLLVYLSTMRDVRGLFSFLKSKEDCSATRQALIDADKVLRCIRARLDESGVAQ